MYEQKDGTQAGQPTKKQKDSRSRVPSAFAFDRDKNLFYWANDESVDEILDADGYHVVHANRSFKKKKI